MKYVRGCDHRGCQHTTAVIVRDSRALEGYAYLCLRHWRGWFPPMHPERIETPGVGDVRGMLALSLPRDLWNAGNGSA